MNTHTHRNNNDLHESLKMLFDKYDVSLSNDFELSGITSAPDVMHLLPGWKFSKDLSDNYVPLLPWRSNRKFIELKNIVETQTIEDVALMRLSCYSIDHDLWPLKAILYRELDLCEFLSGSKIATLNHVANKSGECVNIVVKLENGVLCSIEIGMDLTDSISMPPLIERHEIIGARGTCSDLVVDTQIPQSSIYAFTQNGMEIYNDIDMELFGYEPFEVDHIRSAFQAYQHPEVVSESILQHVHLYFLMEGVMETLPN
ncbi:hypothetical protein KUV50_13565 [Membranicola marinus]|uniref:Uncharacterized protein n=1 Tax=Membranihabitans marinus TaxID=1227546 RepID=A0A953L9T7_9BACT|nr:hypothetical protein [Membranihabitans marinus]MBY5959175.1 hypothetical protein [Membranihabitans marinus]